MLSDRTERALTTTMRAGIATQRMTSFAALL